ncbi:DUF1778 domain-containing protein [Xenorhabdus bovienii]|uniref:type II toxin -antitoxin system TacA 1-like antitoxin n=1 Tax=Xenorhabdus bovienii TaxID=40576 RepID=UPI0023B23BEE|nr:DUF1778 domain-containing protein [Xenorhabdus bovienii]MDE9494537.1 DUF1778 domain-containing protein [Xenorhabdus bovienii]MDE9502934.1 DUF1778 domain-containing protein [Xenorhabdus bovienii]MDE9526584.1 DUF1778 domain-containing protein [Xenorhabdus bovienii]
MEKPEEKHLTELIRKPMNKTIIDVNQNAYDALLARLNTSPKPNEQLIKTMKMSPP